MQILPAGKVSLSKRTTKAREFVCHVCKKGNDAQDMVACSQVHYNFSFLISINSSTLTLTCCSIFFSPPLFCPSCNIYKCDHSFCHCCSGLASDTCGNVLHDGMKCTAFYCEGCNPAHGYGGCNCGCSKGCQLCREECMECEVDIGKLHSSNDKTLNAVCAMITEWVDEM